MSCDRPDMFWSTETQETFTASVKALLAHYSFLARHSVSNSLCRYSIVQKHHLLAHFHKDTKYLAPRCYWTYGSESFMGILVNLDASCTRGTPAEAVALKIMTKYRLALFLSWKHELDFEE